MPPDEPPPPRPGSPEEARALLFAIKAEVHALNVALNVHAQLLERHTQLLQQALGIQGAKNIQDVTSGILDRLTGLTKSFEDPPERRRRGGR